MTLIAVLEVGALIFVLGIDLVKEAVWDTRHRASLSEYITILGAFSPDPREDTSS